MVFLMKDVIFRMTHTLLIQLSLCRGSAALGMRGRSTGTAPFARLTPKNNDFTRKTTYYNRKFDIIDPSKLLTLYFLYGLLYIE